MNDCYPNISILVDGYNLMLGSVVRPEAKAKRSLHDARHYFLSWLDEKLPTNERSKICVVFDTARTSDRDQQSNFHGIRIIYSSSHVSADECIQKLIKDHSNPRCLTVVSSDHQIQRTARARGATTIDSEMWIEEIESNKPTRTNYKRNVSDETDKPDHQIDARKWLDEFGF